MVDVLTAAAHFDQRRPGKADVEAWLVALGPAIPKDDAIECVVEHYRRSTDRVMPAHVLALWEDLKATRRAAHGYPTAAQLEAAGWDPDVPGTYVHAIRNLAKAVEAGADPKALTS